MGVSVPACPTVGPLAQRAVSTFGHWFALGSHARFASKKYFSANCRALSMASHLKIEVRQPIHFRTDVIYAPTKMEAPK
jgi:hypothetical protein